MASTAKGSYTLVMPELVVRDFDILGGEPVFAGTRVPLKALTDYIEAGETIDAFITDFPTVTRAQVRAFLEMARTLMAEA